MCRGKSRQSKLIAARGGSRAKTGLPLLRGGVENKEPARFNRIIMSLLERFLSVGIVRKAIWRLWYPFLTRRLRGGEVLFLN